MMPQLSVYLFSTLRVVHATRHIPALASRKAQELFCYLLLHRDRPYSREVLAGLLWGDTTTEQSKTYLRKALWQLQTVLEPPSERLQERTLLIEHDAIRMNPHAALWLDVAVLEQAFQCVEGIAGEHLDPNTAASLRCAVDLYHGDLLDGWYQDWCLYERERLQHMYLALLDKLMGYCEAQQEYESGLAYGIQLLRYDRAREQTHRRMMRLHALSGDRTAALRQFERCTTALVEELGVQPTPYTMKLYEHILHNQLDSSGVRLDDQTTTPEGDTPLTDMLRHLRQFQHTVSALQHSLQRNIQAIEQALRGQP
jgi:DNA-binding SARP family transcriptional activator